MRPSADTENPPMKWAPGSAGLSERSTCRCPSPSRGGPDPSASVKFVTQEKSPPVEGPAKYALSGRQLGYELDRPAFQLAEPNSPSCRITIDFPSGDTFSPLSPSSVIGRTSEPLASPDRCERAGFPRCRHKEIACCRGTIPLIRSAFSTVRMTSPPPARWAE